MTDEPHTTDPIAEARRIVVEADEALAALPAARAFHAALVREQVLAIEVADRAMDHLWPLLATVVGFDARVDAERALAWKANEAAMGTVRKTGGEAMEVEGDVSRLEQASSGQDAMEARHIVGAADDLAILRQVVGMADGNEARRRSRVM